MKNYIFIYFIGLIINPLFFLLLFIFKRNLYPSEIIFYESINILIIYSILSIFVMYYFFKKILKYSFQLSLNVIIPIIISSFFLLYSFMITFPSLSNRSISLSLLSNIEENSIKGGLTFNEIEKSIVNDFIINGESIKIRLNEQIYSNNIYIENDKYLITKSGKRINNFNKFIIKIFNL